MAHVRGPITTGKGTAYDVLWRDPDGRFRQERVYGGVRKAEARARAIDTAKHEGRYHDTAPASRRTFQEVAEEWLTTLTRPRPETVQGYQSSLRLYAYPAFGQRKLGTIKPGDLGRWVNELKQQPTRRGTGLHPDTIKRAFGITASVFGYAVEQGLLLRNPAQTVKLPTEDTMGLEPFSGHALSLAEVSAIAQAAAQQHPMYGLLVRFLAATGLRAGELSGLRLQDVAPDGASVSVRRTATRAAKAPDGIRLSVPKSRTSRRTVPVLDHHTAQELAAHIAAHPNPHPDAPVFPARLPGGARTARTAPLFNWDRPMDPGIFRRRVFDTACQTAGVRKIRLHDLRHTAGSLWLAAGVSLFNVSRYLGHSSVDFTARVYGHVLEASAASDAARFTAYREGTETHKVLPFRKLG